MTICYSLLADTLDHSTEIRIIDSTDGTPETGVVFNTSGIDLWYRRVGAASVDITEATLAALTTAHADGGFLHINDGYYRLDLPDAAVASGATAVLIGGTVTGMIVIGTRINLTPQPVDIRQYLGTAVPNPTVAGVPEVDVTHWNGTAVATPTVAGVPEVDITHLVGVAQSATDLKDFADDGYDPSTNKVQGVVLTDTVTTYTGNTVQTGDSFARIGATGSGLTTLATQASVNALPTAAVNADAVWDEDATGHQTQGTFGQAIGDPVADTNTLYKAVVTDAAGANVGADIVAVKAETAAILVDTGTTLDAALAVVDANVDSILVDTAEIGTAGAGLTNINLPNQTMDIVGNITGNLSGSVGSVTALTTGNIADAVLDEDMTAHQTQGTLGQAIGDPVADADTIWGLLKTNLNATVTSRASQASADTIDDFLDTEIAAIKAKTDLIPGTIDGKTFSEIVTLVASVLIGKASGLGGLTAVFRAIDDSKDRVTATVDTSGNRSAVVVDAT